VQIVVPQQSLLSGTMVQQRAMIIDSESLEQTQMFSTIKKSLYSRPLFCRTAARHTLTLPIRLAVDPNLQGH
jgi:hypothetical protein